jgi:hypothetical protein
MNAASQYRHGSSWRNFEQKRKCTPLVAGQPWVLPLCVHLQVTVSGVLFGWIHCLSANKALQLNDGRFHAKVNFKTERIHEQASK